jgi:hypothetical protein
MTVSFRDPLTMRDSQSSKAQSSKAAARTDASWTLPRGRAQRLTIGPGARLLRVSEGRVWLTIDGAEQAPADDLWLRAGEQIRLPDGAALVLEAWGEARFQLLVPPDACAGQGRVGDLAAHALHRVARALAGWLPARRLAAGGEPIGL